MKNVVIEKIVYVEAPDIITSNEIENQLEPTCSKFGLVNNGWFEDLTGVKERRFWKDNISVADVALLSAKKLMSEIGFNKNKIGAIINCSVSLDFGEPTISIILHNELNLSQKCITFDVANACMGFTSAFEIISNMIKLNQIEYGLIVAGENGFKLLTNTINNLNNNENVTFDDLQRSFAALTIGSGSVSMLLTSEENATSNHKVLGSLTLTDSKFWEHCVGALDRSWLNVDASNMMKDGADILKVMEQETVKSLPDFNNNNVDVFIPHQISKRHNEVLCDVTSITKDKLYVTYPFLGNVGPASWPISLYLAEKDGSIKKGQNVGVCSMGSGFNCSCMLLNW